MEQRQEHGLAEQGGGQKETMAVGGGYASVQTYTPGAMSTHIVQLQCFGLESTAREQQYNAHPDIELQRFHCVQQTSARTKFREAQGVCVKSSLPLRYKPRRAKLAWRGDPYLHKASGALNSLFRKYRDTINNYFVVNTLLLLV